MKILATQKLTNHLNEGKVIAPEKKQKLLGYIQHNIEVYSGKNSGQLFDLSNVIYQGLLRGKYEERGQVDQNFLQKAGPAFQQVIRHMAQYPNAAMDAQGEWLGFSFNSGMKTKVNGQTFNYYITLERTPENMLAFIKNIYTLYQLMALKAKESNVALSFKLGQSLNHYFEDNDHVKLYYYKPEDKALVESVVSEWLSKAGIKKETRAYTHGVDKDGDSWGSKIATQVADMLAKTMETNKDKYSAQSYLDWLLKLLDSKFTYSS